MTAVPVTHRRKLDKERKSKTVEAGIKGTDGTDLDFFITVGMYEDGTVGELFIKLNASKSDLIQGLIDAWCITFSIALQHGADFETLVLKLAGMKFQPEGQTDHPQIKQATSVVDFAMRWLAREFGSVSLISQLNEEER